MGRSACARDPSQLPRRDRRRRPPALTAAFDREPRLIGHVLAPGNAPSWGKLLDLEMLVMTDGGRERSEVEYRALLRQAGFELERVIPTASITSLIEAVPGQPAR